MTSHSCEQPPELIKARKICQVCMARNPGKIHSGASFEFDPDVISYWSQWLGHPRPHILMVGQDFGDVGYFDRNRGKDNAENKTNDNLYELLTHIGLKPTRPPRPDLETRVYLTNSILCLKNPPMDKTISVSWVRNCAVTHLRPLAKELKPHIVVAMGASGWLAALHAFEIECAPKKITVAAGGSWLTRIGIQVFAVGHCGPKGKINRSWDKQLEDWSRIGNALRLVEQVSD